MSREIENRARKRNQICADLESKGYTVQGCSGTDFSKCYFSKGDVPHSKIAGYIDWNTFEIVYI